MQRNKLPAIMGIAVLLTAALTAGLATPQAAYAAKVPKGDVMAQTVPNDEEIEIESLTVKLKKKTNGDVTARIVQDGDVVDEDTVSVDNLSKRKYQSVTFEFNDAELEDSDYTIEIETNGDALVKVKKDRRGNVPGVLVVDARTVGNYDLVFDINSSPITQTANNPPPTPNANVTLSVNAEMATDASTDPEMWVEIYEGDSIADDRSNLLQTGFTGSISVEVREGTALTVAVAQFYPDASGTVFSKWKDNDSTNNVRTVQMNANTTLTAIYTQGS